MGWSEMAEVLQQIKVKYDCAKTFLINNQIDKADEEVASLSDLLDDIYDRPEEKAIEPEVT